MTAGLQSSEIRRSSCLSDRPLERGALDALANLDFVNGLYAFIIHADTPVTIGIQGGWGSGKTSLINMLREKIEADRRAHCVFVNAWEHSLLQAQGSKLDVTSSLLQGLLEGMREAIESQADNDDAKEKKDSLLKKLTFVSKGVAGLVCKAVLHTATEWDSTGATEFLIQSAGKAGASLDEKIIAASLNALPPSIAATIRAMRQMISEVINEAVEPESARDGQASRFVCFIDDLDRIPPETAVDILDIIKNIFDIEHCVFVLAVDYDVVVKGLESKFGKKTEANEREFRQYFDKIIQIPFSMPVGAYENRLNSLLLDCFEKLGYDFPNGGSEEVLDNLRKAAMAATDGVPRSIKRIINTLSLMRYISSARNKASDMETAGLRDLEARFIVIALNINFPEISRKLMENSNFPAWTLENLDKKWGLQSEGIDFETLKQGFNDLFDEDWEKVVYALCQKNVWLKARANAASILLNALRAALKRDQESAEISETSLSLLDDILEDMRVVSVSSSEDAPRQQTHGMEYNLALQKDNKGREIFLSLKEAIKTVTPDGLQEKINLKYVTYKDGKNNVVFHAYPKTKWIDLVLALEFSRARKIPEGLEVSRDEWQSENGESYTRVRLRDVADVARALPLVCQTLETWR
ncbi:MAG: KAP family NTPase [Zoogloeaceae bacterium]|jgi:predicted transport protein|nr:KAP family NTPase [Zoogloeaceae bacterium]